MTNGRVEVITSVQRRRRWSLAEKQRIAAASLERGAVASAVAREAGIHVSQLFRWRQELCRREDQRLCIGDVSHSIENSGGARSAATALWPARLRDPPVPGHVGSTVAGAPLLAPNADSQDRIAACIGIVVVAGR
jgi:transposase